MYSTQIPLDELTPANLKQARRVLKDDIIRYCLENNIDINLTAIKFLNTYEDDCLQVSAYYDIG